MNSPSNKQSIYKYNSSQLLFISVSFTSLNIRNLVEYTCYVKTPLKTDKEHLSVAV